MTRLLLIMVLLAGIGTAQAEDNLPVVVFAGAASQPPLEEAAQTFQEKTGIPVILHLGGSGAMLNQVRLTGQGDLYIPGSPDYMQKAVEFGLIADEPVTIAYLVPALIVAKGNPLGMESLEDLKREDLRIGLADPDGVCVGLYGLELLHANHLLETVRPNLKGMVESCAKAAAMIPLKMVDVVLGWREFASWQPGAMEAILPRPDEIPRLAYVPGARLSNAKNPQGAKDFLAFLVSREGQAIFQKWGYLTTEIEARKFAPKATIGGTFPLVEVW
jgi:molybdate transport system substrate-binding protein